MEFFPNYNTAIDIDPAVWAKAREAEGWHGIVASDHYWIGEKPFPHLWVTLTRMADATERITLSSSFANNLFRSPVEFSQASLALHVASNGRFEAGLGAGWNEEEMVRTGQDYPPPPVRVTMYREAMTIARSLLQTGTCQFEGEYYKIDVPMLGPMPDVPPLLVGSCGGPRTIREITPLLDRIEIKGSGKATRGGALDMATLAQTSLDDICALADRVRAVRDDIPMGFFAIMAVGEDQPIKDMAAALGDGFYSNLVGPAEKVADGLHRLSAAGISRVQLTEFAPGSVEALAPYLDLD